MLPKLKRKELALILIEILQLTTVIETTHVMLYIHDPADIEIFFHDDSIGIS